MGLIKPQGTGTDPCCAVSLLPQAPAGTSASRQSDGGPLAPFTPGATPPCAQPRAWGAVLEGVCSLLAALEQNHVTRYLVEALVGQVLAYINVQAFNQLLMVDGRRMEEVAEVAVQGVTQVSHGV